MNIRAFSTFLQDSNEVQVATGTTGNPNGWSRA